VKPTITRQMRAYQHEMLGSQDATIV
jgi:hypothetical protein